MPSTYIKPGTRKQSPLKLYVIATVTGLTLIGCAGYMATSSSLDKKTVNTLIETKGRMIKINLLLEYADAIKDAPNSKYLSAATFMGLLRERIERDLDKIRKDTGNPDLGCDDIPSAKLRKIEAIEREVKGMGKSLAVKTLIRIREDDNSYNMKIAGEDHDQIIIAVEKRLAPLMN